MKIGNFFLQELISTGKNFIIYRGLKEDDPVPYIFKILEKKRSRSTNTIKDLKREYAILKQIDSEYVIKAINWYENTEYAVIQLEDIAGTSLKSELKSQSLPVKELMDVSINITNGLVEIHKQNIIHKDINPSNIVINRNTHEVKIIDFSISSTFDIKTSFLGNPEKLKGTLPYISPEQSGRMNQSVDHRTDLYSLGVTFYELFAGQLPFQESNPVKLIYAHMARIPTPPHQINDKINKILSEIIMKLLAKNPFNRYQSAKGLQYDLEKSIEPSAAVFSLGEKDYSGRLQIPEKLYGREQEINQLLSAYRNLNRKTREIVMVTGYSGTGKTALVSEIHKVITGDQGYFTSGKFNQLQRTIPHSAFIEAINQFCSLILSENPELFEQWKNRILYAVGDLGKVLTDIIPQLESIIGKQPDIPPGSSADEKKRFNYVFQQFIKAVSSEEHPLVIFLDDLQWADLASLDLLKLLTEDVDINYFLFIGAYRDNEVTPSHPIMAAFENIRQNKTTIRTIHLKNLLLDDIRQWLADTLNMNDASGLMEITSLARLIYNKTQGNAFFTIQFIENLYKETLLYFDYKTLNWKWDLQKIENLNITDNVVDLMIQKIQTLPQEAQDLLKFCACTGNIFNVHTISVISEKTIEKLEQQLDILISEHMIYPSGDETYKFIHDRIHQAAYSMISEKSKKPLHLKIGRLLYKEFISIEKDVFQGENEQYVFKIVNHFNTALEHITSPDEKLIIAELNLQAGRYARLSTAYILAEEYIKTTLRLLPENCIDQYYDFTLSVYNEYIQVLYLLGKYKEMEELVNKVLQCTNTISDQSIAYEYRLLGLMAQTLHQKAIETLFDILHSLGVDLPRNPTPGQTGEIITRTTTLLAQKGIDEIKNLSYINDSSIKLAIHLYYIGGVAFIFSSQELLPIVISTITALILENGLSNEAPYIIAYYALFRLLMGDISGAYQLGECSLNLLERGIGNDAIKGRSVALVCFYTLGQKQHLKTVCKKMMDYYTISLNAGDFEYAGYLLSNYVVCLSRTDTHLQIISEKARNNKNGIIQLKQMPALPYVIFEIAYNDALLGKTKHPEVLAVDLDKMTKGWHEGIIKLVSWQFYIKSVILAILFEDYNNLPDYLNKALQFGENINVPATYFISDTIFYYPLAYLQLAGRTENENNKSELLEKATKLIEQLKSWADFGPVNYLHKYYLLMAELNHVTGDREKAEEFYDSAIEKACENDYFNEAALASECAAKFFIHNNQHKLASFYFTEAKNFYQRWGAKAKIKYLEEYYPRYLHMRLPGTLLISHSISSTYTTGEFLDIQSIMQASQTLSGEVHLKSLMDKMMNILIENAGAQRSILIENENGQLYIQAESTTSGVSGILQAQPVMESKKIPLKVINYVAHSKKELVFDNLTQDPDYSSDEYVQKNQPKSVVCFPISSKGELTAIIYLENNLVEGAFTPSRLELINILSAQIAISMENTHLYENLEVKVKQRTILLHKAHSELERKHKELQKANNQIISSINYAQRIQVSILPDTDALDNIFSSYFILWKPRDIVGGDFYWCYKVQNGYLFSLLDCTGHGVPGAFMSMMGRSIFDHIVSRICSDNPAVILQEVNKQIQITLSQDKEDSLTDDGMDAVLCFIKPGEKKMIFAGAGLPLYYFKNHEFHEIKGDIQSLGYTRSKLDYQYANHEITLEGDEFFYLTSDGYIDQAGGEKRIAFGRKRFITLISENYSKPLKEQKNIFTKVLYDYMKDVPQRDDITIIGFSL